MSPISDPITTINWPFLKQEVEQDPDNVRELAFSCPICYELMSNSSGHNDLASYGRLLDSEVRLGPDQSIAFRVYNPEGEIYGLRRNLEIPSDLESIWSHAKQLLQIQSARFWFEMDVGAFEFAISVFELYP
ncbi:hypothetical protein ACLX1H_006559 [Fusarium chlamydosporum]